MQQLLLNPVFNYLMDTTIGYFIGRIFKKIINWFGFSCDTGKSAIPEPVIVNQTINYTITYNYVEQPTKPLIEERMRANGSVIVVGIIVYVLYKYVNHSKNTQREKYIIEAMEEYNLTLQEQLEILPVEERDMDEDMRKREAIRVAKISCRYFLKGKLNCTDAYAENFVELFTKSHSLLL